MTDACIVHAEERVFVHGGRSIRYEFRPAAAPGAPLLVVFHGHSKSPRASRLKDPRWNILLPIDDFGLNGYGSWYLGERGDHFWLSALPQLIREVHDGPDICFMGSSMGGYAAILHGVRNKARAVYANIPQTRLLGSAYARQGMAPYFQALFGPGRPGSFNDLRDVLSPEVDTSFILTGTRWDKPLYLAEQTFPFVSKLTEYDIEFSLEIFPVKGHSLTIPFHEVVNRLMDTMKRQPERPAPRPAPGAGGGRKRPPYESFAEWPEGPSKKAADDILKHGWSRRNYPPLELNGPIPWNYSFERHRTWNFFIHSFDMISPLLAAYNAFGDRDYLVAATRVALDWAAAHPRSESEVSNMAWYDMAVGLRAYRLAYLYQAAGVEGLLTPEKRRLLWRAIEDHRAELADDSKIMFHNNHGYYQIAGQLAMGRRLAHLNSGMRELFEQGIDRFGAMLDQQFSGEGVHREHSPDYHRMVLTTLQGIIRSGLIDDPGLNDRSAGIERSLSWFVLPSGTITNFGDSDARSMLCDARDAERLWDTTPMRAVTLWPPHDLPRPEGLKLFRESGYAVIRTPCPEAPRDGAQDSYLAQTAAFHSRTHKHADDLSFVWSDQGGEILVDAGRYGYIGKAEQGSEAWLNGSWYADPMRLYVESTRAHNTLEFDGKDNPRKGVKPYGSAIADAVETQGCFAIETRCKQFGAILHDRILVFRPRHWLVVFDVFTDNKAEEHEVRQWFHAAPGAQVTPDEHGYRMELPGGQVLRAGALLPGSEALPVENGVEQPRLQGWWSGQEREALPAPAFGFMKIGQARGSFATLFTFGEGFEPDHQWSQTNVTGRRFRLRWHDDEGEHTVAVNREDGLKIEMTER